MNRIIRNGESICDENKIFSVDQKLGDKMRTGELKKKIDYIFLIKKKKKRLH